MAKDPAILWYWSDWNSGTVTFSRHLKGCYMDLLHAQFNSGHLSLEEIKTVLGSDFGLSWPTLQKKFATDPQGFFFNKRLDEEREKRMKFSASRRANAKAYPKASAKHTHKRMENENRNEDENQKLKEYEDWTLQILDNNDSHFEQMLMSDGLKMTPERFTELVKDHYGLLCRYPKMRPNSQQSFRGSVLKHLRENNGKRTNNHRDQFAELDRLLAQRRAAEGAA